MQTALITTFLSTLVILGLMTAFVAPPELMPLDNRYTSAPPAIPRKLKSLKDFPPKFEAFYRDRFFGRTQILTWRNQLYYLTLRSSGNPLIIVGPDGWLQFAGDGNLASFLNRSPYFIDELGMLAQEFEDRKQWLASRGIKYLLVLVPDKATVYPQSMPAYYKASVEPSRLSQLTSYLSRNSTVDFIDLRHSLAGTEAGPLLYWKTDTHWNPVGAYRGYQAICGKVGLKPIAAEFKQEPFTGGLAIIGGLGSMASEMSPCLDLRKSQICWSEGADKPRVLDDTSIQFSRCLRVADAKLPKCVLLHDSFMDPMNCPFLPCHFRQTVALTTNIFPYRTIAAQKPDIVIEEHIERALLLGALKPTPGLHDLVASQQKTKQAPL
jgi:alginate O-acetyltransferase complex protein AlgJ